MVCNVINTNQAGKYFLVRYEFLHREIKMHSSLDGIKTKMNSQRTSNI